MVPFVPNIFSSHGRLYFLLLDEGQPEGIHDMELAQGRAPEVGDAPGHEATAVVKGRDVG